MHKHPNQQQNSTKLNENITKSKTKIKATQKPTNLI